MRIAVISDIHGNLTALEAVLADPLQSYLDKYAFRYNRRDAQEPMHCLAAESGFRAGELIARCDEWC